MDQVDIFIDLVKIKKEIQKVGLRANDDQLKRDLYRVLEELSFALSNYLLEERDKKNQVNNARLAETKNLLERVIENVDDLRKDMVDISSESTEEFDKCTMQVFEAINCLNNIG